MVEWYKSKTFWTNLFAAVVLFVGVQFGYQITAEETGIALVGINWLLRAVTKEPIEW